MDAKQSQYAAFDRALISKGDDIYLIVRDNRIRVNRIDIGGVEVHSESETPWSQGDVVKDATISIGQRQAGDLTFIVDDALWITGVVRLAAADPRTSHSLWRITRDSESGCNESALHVPCRNEYSEAARQKRVEFITTHLGKNIDRIARTTIPAEEVEGNIEGYIGSIEIPVAIAGPLRVNGLHANGVFYAPMATTEGALISSITRGSIALTRAGGVTSHTIWQRMIRAPVFNMQSVDDALFLAAWITSHKPQLMEVISYHSRHAQLVDLDPRVVGNNLHMKFIYETGDASGQNMTTKCTWEAGEWIVRRFDQDYPGFIKAFIIDGNMSTDKKVSYSSFINGRGIKVTAEAWISEKILTNVLKVSKEKILKAFHDIALGANQSGMVGMNINVANVIAAIFTATGQDIACVHESSLGQLFLEPTENGIYCSLTLTNLIIGTVGGGTGLAHQREALEIIGCRGVGKIHKLAEIIASFCLALDMSTLAAVSGGQFVHAHENLGRNRPK